MAPPRKPTKDTEERLALAAEACAAALADIARVQGTSFFTRIEATLGRIEDRQMTTLGKLAELKEQGGKIMATAQEVLEMLGGIDTTIDGWAATMTEIKTDIETLITLVNSAGNIPQEIVDAVTALGTKVNTHSDELTAAAATFEG